VPSSNWLLWVAVSERTGRLKSRSDSAVRTAAVRTHARAPDRAAARARLTPRAAFRPPSAILTAQRLDRRCPTPRARPVRSQRRRIRAVDAAVYTAVPLAAGRRRAAVPPDAAIYAVVPHRRPRFGEPRHVSPAISRAPVRAPP
jgi:hypothetical protein